VATVLIGLETLAGGATDLMHGRTSLVSGPFVLDVITHLGYPAYLLVILGIWKVLGGIVLFLPGLLTEGMGVCRHLLRSDGGGRVVGLTW
jgi:DoxX-like family